MVLSLVRKYLQACQTDRPRRFLQEQLQTGPLSCTQKVRYSADELEARPGRHYSNAKKAKKEKIMLVQTDPGFPDTPAARIPLQNGMYALVDPDFFDVLIQFSWYAKKSNSQYYACRKVTDGKSVWFIRMHRLIANAPIDLVCHHINGKTLDNRRANLQNMSWFEHAKYYSYR